MESKNNNLPEQFFRERVDWPLFYQEKMAMCELVDILEKETEDIKKKNAIEWLTGVLNMMDEMGDVAESLGLFEYPERDLYTDQCFDERYNDVLMQNPNDTALALVTMTVMSPSAENVRPVTREHFLMSIPATETERAESAVAYAKKRLLCIVHHALTAKNAMDILEHHSQNRDFNWADAAYVLTQLDEKQMQQDFQCRYIPPFTEEETSAASLYINIDVRYDASCYPNDWECRPCRIFIGNPTHNSNAGETSVFAAKANLKTGRVLLTSEQEAQDVRQKATDAVLWLVFDGHDYSDKIRMYKTAGDAEDDCGFYWL